jgi:hypothetical protein
VSVAFNLFKPLLSREITDTFNIFGRADAAKAAAMLCADIDPAIVPACYGGTLPCLTAEMHAEIGMDTLEPSLLAQYFCGPTENMGGFHNPPA